MARKLANDNVSPFLLLIAAIDDVRDWLPNRRLVKTSRKLPETFREDELATIAIRGERWLASSRCQRRTSDRMQTNLGA